MEPKDVLFFDKMLTPTIIVVVYWLILVAAVVGGLVTMFTSSFLTGLLALIGGVLFGRIWCELLIVLFKMNDALQTLKNR